MSAWRFTVDSVVAGILSAVLAVGGSIAWSSLGPASAIGRNEIQGPPAALDAVACPNTLVCVAVGGAGGVLVSQTGGRTWFTSPVPTTHFLYGVACTSTAHCVAVGDAGTALATDNGGKTWRVGSTGVSAPLTSVACPDALHCFAVGDGDTVIATQDGGLRWHRQLFAGLGTAYGVACSSPTRCAAATSNAVENLVTVDGSEWTTATVPFSPLDALFPLNGIACATTTCVAVGDHGLLARSPDGGLHWSSGQSNVLQSVMAAACPSDARCVAVGQTGTILSTGDGGSTWQAELPPTGETLLGVSCPTIDDCVAVGSGGTVLTTADGGTHWTVRAGGWVPPAPIRVLVVGDSFAHTLAIGLDRNAPAYSIELIDGSSDGCALARGNPTLMGGRLYPITGPCAPTGPGWQAQDQADVATYRPALSSFSARGTSAPGSSPANG